MPPSPPVTVWRCASALMLLLFAIICCSTNSELTLLPNATHLFLDLEGIQTSTNVTFLLGEVHKEYASPVVTSEFPWEAGLHFYTSALAVPASLNQPAVVGEFRIYYSCFVKDSAMYLCLSKSPDGITWTKPLSTAFPYNGSATNRVFQVNASSPGSWPGSIFIDTRAGVPALERFKLTYEGDGAQRLLYLAISPDGINWMRRSPEVPIISSIRFSDTQTAIVYDTATSRYLAFGRNDAALPGNTTVGCWGAWSSLRRVMLAVSTVSADGPYSLPVQVLGPGTPDAIDCLDIYNPAPIQVSGALLLLPSSYLHFPATAAIPAPLSNTTANDGVLDIRLAASRDGLNYSFVSRDVFLSRGVGYRDSLSGAFTAIDSDLDAGFVFATAGGLIDTELLLLPPNAPLPPFHYNIPSARVSLLYFGTQRTHGGSITTGFQAVMRATLRREGWAAASSPLNDPFGQAEFVTLPLTVPTPNSSTTCGASAQLWLLINARTSVAGRIAVTLLHPVTLVPLPGFDTPIVFTGNAIRAPLAWSTINNPSHPTTSDISSLAGQQIAVCVNLVHASLFAWEVQCVV
jgi:hypothetical protein